MKLKDAFTPINDLVDEIHKTYLPLFPSVYEALNTNVEPVSADADVSKRRIGESTFKSVFYLAYTKFVKQLPRFLQINVSQLISLGRIENDIFSQKPYLYKYQFFDNFKECLDNDLDIDNELVLLPHAAVTMQLLTTQVIPANNWFYQPVNHCLYTAYNSVVVQYAADYPYVLTISESGGFTEDSGIYLIDKNRIRMFFFYLAREVLVHIKNNFNSVELPGVPKIYNVDGQLEEINKEIELIIEALKIGYCAERIYRASLP